MFLSHLIAQACRVLSWPSFAPCLEWIQVTREAPSGQVSEPGHDDSLWAVGPSGLLKWTGI